jgi:uncharacterized protein YaaN involved in tellurite resistance
MAGKKKTETPVVEVSVTSTQVTEKPKRTRKKSATINTREVATVISEITDKKGTVGEATTAVAKILESKEKKVSTFRRINDDGVVNMSEFTRKELDEYHEIGKKLDVHDKMSISNYGAELSEQLNKSTKDLMKRSSSTRLGDETKSIMKEISAKLVTIDLDDIKRPNAFVRFVRSVPLLNKMFFSVKAFIAKCENLEKDVEMMQEKLHAAQAIALRDNTELEQRFQETISYIDVLEKLIVAAKLKSEEYGKALEVMESQPDRYSAIDIHDTRNFKHELDKRVEAMLTWHLSFNQSLFRIRDIQDANIAHSNSISQDIDNMMPMLRDQLQQAVYLYNLEQGLKAHEAMIDGFNEILTHNADATHDLKVRVTKMTENPSIKLETLKHNQEKIKETTVDCLRIIDEAAKDRLNNEREMAKMRAELDSMMSGVAIDKRVASAAAIEAKYTINGDTDCGPQ